MSGEPLSDFQEGQWWVIELDKMASSLNSTADQKRAVAVVHNMLAAAEREAAKAAAQDSAPAELPPLPEPVIEGTVYHQEHKICYFALVHFTADQMREYGKACFAAALAAAPASPQPVAKVLSAANELQALLTRIDDAFESYERHGGICEFEGQPMIHASTLEEIITLRGEYHVAQLAAASTPTEG